MSAPLSFLLGCVLTAIVSALLAHRARVLDQMPGRRDVVPPDPNGPIPGARAISLGLVGPEDDEPTSGGSYRVLPSPAETRAIYDDEDTPPPAGGVARARIALGLEWPPPPPRRLHTGPDIYEEPIVAAFREAAEKGTAELRASRPREIEWGYYRPEPPGPRPSDVVPMFTSLETLATPSAFESSSPPDPGPTPPAK